MIALSGTSVTASFLTMILAYAVTAIADEEFVAPIFPLELSIEVNSSIALITFRHRGANNGGDIDNLCVTLHGASGPENVETELPDGLLKPGQVWSFHKSLQSSATDPPTIEVNFKYGKTLNRTAMTLVAPTPKDVSIPLQSERLNNIYTKLSSTEIVAHLNSEKLADLYALVEQKRSTKKILWEENFGSIVTGFVSFLAIFGTLGATWLAQSPTRVERAAKRKRALISFQGKLGDSIKATSLKDAYNVLMQELSPSNVPRGIRKQFSRLNIDNLKSSEEVKDKAPDKFTAFQDKVRKAAGG